MSDSYLMVFKEEDGWMVRAGFMFDGVMQPVEFHGNNEELEVGLNVMISTVNELSELDNFQSHTSWIPMRLDNLSQRTLVNKCSELIPNWGIVLFAAVDDKRWIAVTGYREQLDDREFAVAEADRDLNVAIGCLKVKNATEAFEWKKDMVHRVNARNEDGEVTRLDEEAQARRTNARRSQVSANWKKWKHSPNWDKVIRNPHLLNRWE